MKLHNSIFFFFFFNDTATTEIYTLSLHDALPILIPSKNHVASTSLPSNKHSNSNNSPSCKVKSSSPRIIRGLEDLTLQERSEEHTSELQSQSNLVCRLLLEKKKKQKKLYIQS